MSSQSNISLPKKKRGGKKFFLQLEEEKPCSHDPDNFLEIHPLISPKRWPISSSGKRLARSAVGDAGALGAGLATSDGNRLPGPVGAGTVSAEDVDLGSIVLNGALDAIQSQAGDRDAVGGVASGRAVLVVLLDDDAVLGDAGEGAYRMSVSVCLECEDGECLHVAVGNVGNLARSVVDGLDADAVLRVGDGRGGDGDVLHGVVGPATDTADGETMTA